MLSHDHVTLFFLPLFKDKKQFQNCQGLPYFQRFRLFRVETMLSLPSNRVLMVYFSNTGFKHAYPLFLKKMYAFWRKMIAR